ncbi:MAG: carboxy-terminal-processing protease, carboxyl-terminal processing protease [Candidatus Parcubacteria bacterium]|jgi:carboxyl-terminal processing protease
MEMTSQPVPIKKSKWKIITGRAFIGACLLVIGFFVGSMQTVIASKLDNKVNITTFWRVWNILDKEFVNTTHRNPGTPDDDRNATGSEMTLDANLSKEDRRLYGAIKGMVEAEGDPYTTFFSPQEAKGFETEIKGSFDGVGMEVGKKDGVITVIAPLPDSPAAKAGIKAGDKVLSINGKSTTDMSIDAAVNMIRGVKGTTVKLSLYRDGLDKPLELTLTRDTIKLPTLEKKYDAQTGIYTIKLYAFSEQVSGLFKDAITDFHKTGSKKLILDLRGNPGGYLDAAVDIASWFIPAGKVIVSQDYGAKKPQDYLRSVGYDLIKDDVKIVVLVDSGSASASEIVAGALQDHGRAKLVGQQTFGKGSVQEYLKITENTGLKVTIARWLTPKGNSISVGGLTPDVEVKYTEDDVKNKIDPQYKKAVELLAK